MNNEVLIFSDLDGCLLNKHDYSFKPAIPVLERIHRAEIPLILASSKTVAEMRLLAGEMQLRNAPLICENGGAIYWGHGKDSEVSILGIERTKILQVLNNLKRDFQFDSFADLGVPGVMKSTDLPEERAVLALQRTSTEPLLWNDNADKLDRFAEALERNSLSLTRGGRFWHVAGPTSKGRGLESVLERHIMQDASNILTLAIGDSPIDQSMLDIANYPIGIPAADGVVHVQMKGHNSRVAQRAGALGWAESVAAVLDELKIP